MGLKGVLVRLLVCNAAERKKKNSVLLDELRRVPYSYCYCCCHCFINLICFPMVKKQTFCILIRKQRAMKDCTKRGHYCVLSCWKSFDSFYGLRLSRVRN